MESIVLKAPTVYVLNENKLIKNNQEYFLSLKCMLGNPSTIVKAESILKKSFNIPELILK